MTKIFYFTGTGNSLFIARELARAMNDAEVLSIVPAVKKNMHVDASCVGIVFPVYAMGTPEIVTEFLHKLIVKPDAYVFAVTNYGGMGGAALYQVQDALDRRGIKLSYYAGMQMPDNYPILKNPPRDAEQKKMFDKASAKVAVIAAAVSRKTVLKTLKKGLMTMFWDWLYRMSIPHFPASDKHFNSDEKCISCGLCSKVCPVDNIQMIEGKPLWKHACLQCCACMNWCPKKAIQWGKVTIKRGRYHHPAVTPDDIIKSK
jgi:ferredoxin